MTIDKTRKPYLMFSKYRRGYLSQVTGYSKGHLSRIASGAKLPDEVFKGRCSHTLNEPEEELFRLIEPSAARIEPLQPGQPNQDLLETIDELASRLTKAEAEIESIKAELKQYG